MSLRVKASAWIIGVFLVCLFAMNILLREVTLTGFEEAEADYASKTVDRLRACFGYENTIYKLNAGLWGHRVPLYQYMDTRDIRLAQSVINLEVLISSGTCFIALLDLSGNVVFEMTLSRDHSRERPLSYTERSSIAHLFPHLEKLTQNGEAAGLYVLGDENYMIGICRISPSSTLPSRGYCIVGTRATERIPQIESALQNPLNLFNTFKSGDYSGEIRDLLEKAQSSGRPFTIDMFPKTLNVWVPHEDILGTQNVVAMFEQPRFIYLHGKTAIATSHGALVLVGLVLLFAVLFLLERILFRRMTLLYRAGGTHNGQRDQPHASSRRQQRRAYRS